MERLTITITEQMLAHVDDRGANRSGTIQLHLDRYLEILRRERAKLRQTFSEAETGLILDAMNGAGHREPFTIAFAASAVAEAMSMDGLDEKWNVDAQAMTEKLSQIESSYPANAAIVDACERFWLTVERADVILADDLETPFTDIWK